MADISKTIEIVFGAVDNTGGALSALGNNLDSFAGKAQSITGPMADLSEGILKLELAAVAAGVAFAALAVNEFGKLQSSVNEIGTLFGGTTDDIGAFRDQIADYATGSTQSIQSITDAVYAAVSAGVEYKDSLDLVRQAEQLAVAGKGDLSETTKALVSSLNAYGESSDKAQQYADALFVTVREGQTTLPELANSLAQVTGIAANAGVDFDSLLAAVAALTAAGLPTSQAITGIKAALSNIIKPTKDAEGVAQELGIEFDAAALKSQGFAGFLDTVSKATGGNIETMGKLFGSVEGLNVVMSLTGTGAEKFANTLVAMANKSGEAAKGFEIMQQNLELINQNLANNLKVGLAAVGEQLIEGYGDLAASLADVFKGFTIIVNDGAFDDLFAILNDAQGELAEWLAGVAKAMPEAFAGLDFSGLAAAFDELGGSISGLFNGLDLTKPEDLRKVVQFAVDSLESLTRVTAGIVDGLKPLIELIIKTVDGINNTGDGAKDAAGYVLGLAQSANELLKVISGIGPVMDSFGSALTAIAGIFIGKSLLVNTGSFGTALAALAASGGKAALALGPQALLGALAGITGLALGKVIEDTTGLGSAINDLLVADSEGEKRTLGTWIYDLVNATEEADQATQEYIATLTAEEKAHRAAEAVQTELENAKRGYGNTLKTTTEFQEAWNQKLKESAKAEADAAAAIREHAGYIEELAKSMEKAKLDTGQYASSTDDAKSNLQALQGEIERLTDKYGANSPQVQRLTELYGLQKQELTLLQGGYSGAAGYVEDLSGKYGSLTPEVDKTTKALEENAGKLTEVQKAAIETERQLAELASNEKIKAMEFTATIKVAEIEAQTKQVEAAFNSIGDTVESLSGQISSMVDSFTNAGDWYEMRQIEDWIDRSMDMQEAAMKKQGELIDAQIAQIEARTEALNRGDSLIKIESGGLEPHLEAFMWEILRAIQVRVNEDGLDLLLGAT